MRSLSMIGSELYIFTVYKDWKDFIQFVNFYVYKELLEKIYMSEMILISLQSY
jgi:hypothetical protein